MEKEAVFEEFTLPEENKLSNNQRENETYTKVKTNKQYEGTIKTLHILATQRNTSLLRMILNSNQDAEELLSYLQATERPSFAHFLERYVEEPEQHLTRKYSASVREM